MGLRTLAVVFFIAGVVSILFSDHLSALFCDKDDVIQEPDFELPQDLWRPAFVLLGVAWLLAALMLWLER